MKTQWIRIEDDMPKKKCIATYLNSHGNRRTIVAEYVRKFAVESHEEDECAEENPADGQLYKISGWYEQQDNCTDYSAIYVHEGDVDYWMPLPDAP